MILRIIFTGSGPAVSTGAPITVAAAKVFPVAADHRIIVRLMEVVVELQTAHLISVELSLFLNLTLPISLEELLWLEHKRQY